MKRRNTFLVFLLMSFVSFGQTTYLVNGPISGQGPLLNTQSSNSTVGWTEIHSFDSGLGSSDNSWSAAQTIPFAFEFYGSPVTDFCVSKNYLLTFDAAQAGTTLPAAISTDNTSLPNATLPNNTIAYHWGGIHCSIRLE